MKELLELLRKRYDEADCSLCLVEQGGKWKLGLRKEYLYLTEKLLSEGELDKGTQETLAVIAFKQPVLQSEIIKIRGNGAYEHIKKLKDLEFISSEKSGRTRLLKLTGKFYDYFDVVADQLERKLSDAVKDEG